MALVNCHECGESMPYRSRCPYCAAYWYKAGGRSASAVHYFAIAVVTVPVLWIVKSCMGF